MWRKPQTAVRFIKEHERRSPAEQQELPSNSITVLFCSICSEETIHVCHGVVFILKSSTDVFVIPKRSLTRRGPEKEKKNWEKTPFWLVLPNAEGSSHLNSGVCVLKGFVDDCSRAQKVQNNSHQNEFAFVSPTAGGSTSCTERIEAYRPPAEEA